LAVLGIAGCAPASTASGPPSAAATSAASPGGGASPSMAASDGSPGASAAASPGGEGVSLTWSRVNLGFVSAYVLVRGGEAAVVDTGTGGSEGPIGEALAALGLDWPAVGHVVLTHHHGDHAGSAA